MLRGFFGNLIFANIARMLCGNHLNNLKEGIIEFIAMSETKIQTIHNNRGVCKFALE